MAQNTQSSENRKGGGRGFLSFLLVVVMIAELIVAGYKYPGFLVKKPGPQGTDPTETVSPRPGAEPGDGYVIGPEEYEIDPEDPFFAEDEEMSFEELCEALDLYKLGEAGVDFATGTGPDSDGYQQMDGIGLETGLAYTDDVIASSPSETASVGEEEENVKFRDAEVQLYLVPGAPANVTLTSLPKLTDTNNGYDLTAWQLDLPDDALIYPAALTVPFPDLQGRDPYTSLIAQQYDPAIRRWSYIAYIINEEDRTVTMYLDRSCTAGLFTFLPSAKRSASVWDLFGVKAYAADEKPNLTPYESVNLKFGVLPAQLLRKNADVDPQLAKQIDSNYKAIADRAKRFTDSLELYQRDQAFGMLYSKVEETARLNENETSLASLGVSFYEYAKALPPSSVGTVLTSLGLVYTHINAMREWNASNTWKDIAWTIFKYAPEYAAAFITLFASSSVAPELMLLMGVTLLFRSVAFQALQEQETVEKTSRLDILYIDDGWENLYWDKNKNKIVYKTDYIMNVINRAVENNPSLQAYLDDPENTSGYDFDYAEFKALHESRSSETDLVKLNSFKFANRGGTAGWRLMLDYIRTTYADHPENWADIFMNYMQECSSMAFAYASDAYFAYGLEDSSGYPVYGRRFTINENMMINWVLSNFDQKLMLEFEQACLAQAEKNSAVRLGAYSAMVDRKVSVKLTDQSGKPITFNDLEEYKGKYIIFDVEPIGYTLSSPWRVSMNNSTILKCTYNSYLLANHPTQLLVYENEEAYKKKKDPVARIRVPLIQKDKDEVTIRLGPETMDGFYLIQTYSYHWEGKYGHSMAGYGAYVTYGVWSEDRKTFTLKSPYRGDEELVFYQQSDGKTYVYSWRYDSESSNYYESQSITLKLMDGGFDRMEGIVHNEEKGRSDGDDRDKYGYTGFYLLTERDGHYYVKTTGEEVNVVINGDDADEKWLLESPGSETRGKQIGQLFMSAVVELANKNGYSMKEE